MQTQRKTCPDCGTSVESSLFAEGCPVCQMVLGLEDPSEAPDSSEARAATEPRLHDYEILGEIARGGMGVVYRARQVSLDRIVALKRLLSGPFASEDFVARFRAEAQILAQLRHPNIVTIYEIGDDDGQIFFAMELIDGRSLMELVREHPVEPRRAAQYVKSLAEAVHYAHTQGVLHRDLKPSNVLLGSDDTIKITDFGLSKTVGSDSPLTMTGQVLGTPSYVPPEQADPEFGDAGAWSDIYSTGAILYHLLTGRPPFGSDSLENTLLQVLRSDPVPPRMLNPSVPSDLETVCLKCLEKDPQRRYEAASDLANELDHFLNNRPITAKPAGPLEKGWRWCRRNPSLAGLCLSLAIVFLVGFGATAWQWKRADEASQTTAAALRRMEIGRAEMAFQSGDSDLGLAYLARVLRQEPTDRVAAMRAVSALTERRFPLPAFAPLRHDESVLSTCYGVEGKLVATGSRDRTARVWDGITGKAISEPLRHPEGVSMVKFDPTGRRRLLSVSDDEVVFVWEPENETSQVWRQSLTLRHQGTVNYAEFSSDGSLIATASDDGSAAIWNAHTGEAVCPRLRHESDVLTARFDQSGTRAVTASKDHRAQIWSTETGEPLGSAMVHKDGRVHYAEFSPNGSLVATASRDGTARLWNATTGEPASGPMQIDNWVMEARFSPDGSRLAIVGAINQAELWDGKTGELRDALHHGNHVVSLRFGAAGERAITACRDGTARLWDLRSGSEVVLPMKHRRATNSVDLSPDGRRAVSASDDGTAVVWNLRDAPLARREILHPGVVQAYWSPDGSRILTTCDDAIARIYDSATLQPVGEPMKHPVILVYAAFSPDGSRVVTASRDGRRGDSHKVGSANIWDAASGKLLVGPLRHTKMVTFVKFSPDCKRVASSSSDGTARVWDAESGEPVTPMLKHGSDSGRGNAVQHVDFSPDGRHLLTASLNHSARIWRIESAQASTALLHSGPVLWAEFSPDGSRIVTASADATAILWDAKTFRQIGEPLEHEADVTRATFSPNGRLVATASRDHTARLWNAVTGQPLTPPLAHGDQVYEIGFSPDSKSVVTSSNDGTARVWDAHSGHSLTEPMDHSPQGVTTAWFSPDGGTVLTAASGGSVRLWPLPSTGDTAPEWFIELAEAVAGQQVDAFDRRKRVELGRIVEIREQLRAMPEDDSDPWRKWADSFFREGSTAVEGDR